MIQKLHSKLNLQYFGFSGVTIVAFIILSITMLVSPVHATTSQLTDNVSDDSAAKIDNGKVVWQSKIDGDYEIYLYDIATGVTARLTNDNYNETNPQINGGKVIWQGKSSNTNQIYLYDISTGITTQITNNNYNNFEPQINNGLVVWKSSNNSSLNEIFLYDIASGVTTQLTDNTYKSDFPNTSGGKVVWESFDGTDFEIYLYDTTTGTTTRLTNDNYDQINPQIDNGKIVWQGRDAASPGFKDWEIFLYDIASGVTSQVTNDDFNEGNPIIKEGKIVWQYDFGIGSEIYLYDISSGTTTRLTNNNYDDSSQEIKDGKVVWQGYDGNDYEIYLYDMTNGSTSRLTDNNYQDFDPQTSGGMVVWSGVNGDSEIFLSDGVINQPPTINPGGPYQVNEGGSVQVSATGNDPENGPLTYAWDLDNNGTFEIPGQTVTFSAATLDGPSSKTIRVQVTDNDGLTAVGSTTIQVQNVAPTVSAIIALQDPVVINSSVSVSASFTDPGILDTHTASWNWGDGNITSGTVTESNGSGSVSDSHTYTATGIYTITLIVTDKDNASASQTFQFVSVYDPTPQGLFTGVRLFNSPAGAYPQNPSLTGQVQFGVVAKYLGSAPTGNVNLNFKDANLKFEAPSVSSLIISNGQATLRGTGTINGSGNYDYLVTGLDGSPDAIRFQIRDASNNVIYDTQPGAALTATPTTTITGQVIIH